MVRGGRVYADQTCKSAPRLTETERGGNLEEAAKQTQVESQMETRQKR